VVVAASLSSVFRARPIVIGAVYPTGGSQGPGGIEESRGVSLAAEYVNARGGVKGRRLAIHLEQTDTADMVQAAVERLRRAGAAILVGSYGSTISRPAADHAAQRGMLFWETGAVGELSMEAAQGDRVFRFPPTGGVLGRAAVAFVRDQLAPHVNPRRPLRYTVTYVDDVYGRAVGLGALAALRESGLAIAATLPYDLATVDFDRLAAQVRDARTDVLVASAYLKDGVELRRAVVRARLPLVANIGTSSSYCMPEFGDALGPDAVGAFASDKPDGDILRTEPLTSAAADALRWAREEYHRRHGRVMSAPALSGFAGGLALFGHVMPSSRDLSAGAVAAAARVIDLPLGGLPNGSGLRFSAASDGERGANLRATSVIWQWIRPNTRTVVWPRAFATHPIAFP
jgi:branched-chain amino acid transport system substrate-binding protein